MKVEFRILKLNRGWKYVPRPPRTPASPCGKRRYRTLADASDWETSVYVNLRRTDPLLRLSIPDRNTYQLAKGSCCEHTLVSRFSMLRMHVPSSCSLLSVSTKYAFSVSSVVEGPIPKVNSVFHCGVLLFMMTGVLNSCPLFDAMVQKALIGPFSPSFLMFLPSSTSTERFAWCSIVSNCIATRACVGIPDPLTSRSPSGVVKLTFRSLPSRFSHRSSLCVVQYSPSSSTLALPLPMSSFSSSWMRNTSFLSQTEHDRHCSFSKVRCGSSLAGTGVVRSECRPRPISAST
mmetsp:Transcript_8907/g.22231  ORF Transcript_8907/g.22231 Transcript_8907/m.22231 type:complete len:290 (-) Transcript_8907:719-1588(-)